MILKKPAMAGTLESSDVQITLRPNPNGGVQLNLRSDVMAQFGDAIRDTAYIKTADTANNAWTLETVQTVE